METYRHKQFSPWPLLALGLFFLSKRRRRNPLLAVGLSLFTMQCAMITLGSDDAAGLYAAINARLASA